MSGLIASRLAAVLIVSAGPFVGALDGATVGADEAGGDEGVGDALFEAVGCMLGLTDGELDGAGVVVGEPDGCDVGTGVALGTVEGTAVGAGVPGEPPPPEHALKSALTKNASPVVDRRESTDSPPATQTSLRY